MSNLSYPEPQRVNQFESVLDAFRNAHQAREEEISRVRSARRKIVVPDNFFAFKPEERQV